MRPMQETLRHDAPPRRVPGRARAGAWLVAAAAGLYLAATFAVPLAAERWPAAGRLAALWAPVCHQMPERSLAVGTGFQTVCARCCGVYLGGVLGALVGAAALLARRPPRPVWLLALAAPTVLDFALGVVGLPQLPMLPRLLLAVPPGALAGIYLTMGIGDLLGARTPSPRRERVPHARVAEEPS